MAANRVFSGRCRIEAMAGDGQALLLEGFQVHLDLRLEPEVTAPLPAGSLDGQRSDAAATERATPRRAPLGAQATPTYQQWAVLVALATLLLALASWWVGNEPAQPATEHSDTESLPAPLPEPAASSSGVPSSVAPAAPAVAAPVEPALVVPGWAAPPAAATLPASARPATMSSSTPRPPRALPSMRARTAKTSGAAPSAALAAERGEANPAAAHARAPRLGSDDLLELFGDTK